MQQKHYCTVLDCLQAQLDVRPSLRQNLCIMAAMIEQTYSDFVMLCHSSLTRQTAYLTPSIFMELYVHRVVERGSTLDKTLKKCTEIVMFVNDMSHHFPLPLQVLCRESLGQCLHQEVCRWNWIFGALSFQDKFKQSYMHTIAM